MVYSFFCKKKNPPQIYFLSWPCGFLETVNTRQNCLLSWWVRSANHAPGAHLWMESKREEMWWHTEKRLHGEWKFGVTTVFTACSGFCTWGRGDLGCGAWRGRRHLEDLLHHCCFIRPDLDLRFTSNMSFTEVKPCINSQRPPRNTFHLCGWWADPHRGWGRGGQWESDSRRHRQHQHQNVSADFESLPKKCDRGAERRGFSLFLFSGLPCWWGRPGELRRSPSRPRRTFGDTRAWTSKTFNWSQAPVT